MSSLAAVLHSVCFDAAENADVATCVALLQDLLLRLRMVYSSLKTSNTPDSSLSLTVETSIYTHLLCSLNVQR